MTTLRKMVKNNKGATAIEYGLIAALIAVAAIAGMNKLGGSLNSAFGSLGTKLDTNITNKP